MTVAKTQKLNWSSRKLVAFDLDDTLTATSSHIDASMANLLVKLLARFQVAIITGRGYESIHESVVKNLNPTTTDQITRLHLMSLCGACYHLHDIDKGDWQVKYSYDMTPDQKSRTIRAIKSIATEMGLWEEAEGGPYIEDRGGQITYMSSGKGGVLLQEGVWHERFSRP